MHQILNHSADVNYSAIFANLSDLYNVCNKTSMSLTNFYDHCTVKGPKYIANIFLCPALEKHYEMRRYIFAADVTIYQPN